MITFCNGRFSSTTELLVDPLIVEIPSNVSILSKPHTTTRIGDFEIDETVGVFGSELYSLPLQKGSYTAYAMYDCIIIEKICTDTEKKHPGCCSFVQYIQVDFVNNKLGFCNLNLTQRILKYGTDQDTNLIPNLNLRNSKLYNGLMFGTMDFTFSLEDTYPNRALGCAINAFVTTTTFLPVYVNQDKTVAIILSKYAVEDAQLHARKIEKYDMGGWSNLHRRYLNMKCFSPTYDDGILDKKLSTQTIHVRLDQGRCHDHTTRTFCKTYQSRGDFTVGEVFSKIVDTFWCYVDEHNMDGYCDNLALTSFNFDPATCMVYPSCDS